MFRSLNSSDEFRRAFEHMGRGNQYSPNGFRALYDYLLEIEDAQGFDDELDPIAICCDFTEYEDLTEALEACGELRDYTDEDGTLDEDEAMQRLNDLTTVIEVYGGAIILQNF